MDTRFKTYKIGLLIFCTALIFGCAPKFNKVAPLIKAAAVVAHSTTATPAPSSNRVQGFDGNVSGGGSVGASASYKMSGVNVTPLVKRSGASASNKLKGGFQGQLTR